MAHLVWATCLTPPALGEAARWSREVGVIDYFAKYTRKAPDASGKRAVRACFDAVKAAGLQPEWVDVDIFLPTHRSRREQFKRLVIPTYADWFSQLMYEGMDDYVRRGGLLITNVSMILLDANDNYVADAKDTQTDYPQKRFLGVFGHSSCRISRIRILHQCPLTAGLPVGEWLPLTASIGARRTRTVGAEVIAECNRITNQGETVQPFLTFHHVGKGACIYFVGPLHAIAGGQYRQLIKNVFAPAVVDWLCLQE